ncbi:MAG TPA: serine hydrolase [Candidatus Saccharimonadales bacterium]|nr:serine hydrolase [Candidatus Saccharimonadales bacterium]
MEARETTATPQSQHRFRQAIIALTVASVLLGSGFFIYHKTFLSSVTLVPQKVVAAASSKPPSPSSAAIATLNSQITGLLAQHPELDMSVSVTDIANHQSYHYGESAPFVAASTAKLLTASLYLHQVEAGQVDLDDLVGNDTARNQLQQMIEVSDNGAWEALNTVLGHPALKEFAAAHGLTSYDPDDNTLTSNDVALLLSQLYQKQLLNAEHTQFLLNLMQNANKTDYIVATIPSGVTVYHKAGWLDDRVHDAAIIDNHTHPYVLVIFTKTVDGSAYDETAGQALFHGITSATLHTFN